MKRKEFLKVCGGTCLGFLGLDLIQGCKPTKHIQSTSENNLVRIKKSEFLLRSDSTHYRRNLIARVDTLNFPLVIYRFSDLDYSALLLRCSHQGNELSLNGDILSCSAHGSEFGSKGEVIQGPADVPLQNFRVTHDIENIYIHLS